MRGGILKIGLVILVFLLGLAGTALGGEIIYVDADANGANDGTGWADAHNYLQDALTDASSSPKPVEIRVAEGVYKPDEDTLHPDGTDNREVAFQLINRVTLKGGYAGFGRPDPNARDIDGYVTILSGDLAGNDIEVTKPMQLIGDPRRTDNSYNVVNASGTNSTAILDGFTITKGYVINGSGGGIYCQYNSYPKVMNCIITDNAAYSDSGGKMAFGGGMLNANNGHPTLHNCKFIRNLGGWGGGMCNTIDSSPTVTNCLFFENSSQHLGGGIFNTHNCNSIIRNCLIVGNSGSSGGGIWNNLSRPMLTNCTIVDNRAGYDGGGIYNREGNMRITNCILWDNSPDQIYVKNDTPVITYSYIQGADPLFVDPDKNDFHLRPDSPCIDTGDPSSYFGLEPEPDGGRINMGAYGNTPEATSKGGIILQSYNIVSKTRVGRTVFEYEFTVTLNNNGNEDVSSVLLELLFASGNIEIIDSEVNFAYIEAGEAATSEDTFSLRVNRANAIKAANISWRATFEYAGGGAGTAAFTNNIILEDMAGDVSGDGEVDIEDLARLAKRWLWVGQVGEIAEDVVPFPDGDGIVNLLDFAQIAEKWGVSY